MSTDKESSILDGIHDHNICSNTREIYLYNNTSDEEDQGIDRRQANRFLKNIRFLEGKSLKPIVIHQYSIGGDFSCGMMIFDAIVQCPCPIIIICHGIAASMGSLIPQAAVFHGNAYRVNMPHCEWLIHEGYIGLDSTYREAKSSSQWHSVLMGQMIDIYIRACKTGSRFKGYSDKKIKSYIDRQLSHKQDWWLSARDSIEHGFADVIIGDEGFKNIEYIVKNKGEIWADQ